jgi:hypothetical protein
VHTGFLRGSLIAKDLLKDLVANGTILLKWCLQKFKWDIDWIHLIHDRDR